MIDLHLHCLPGLDDGPPDMEAAVMLCRRAREAGVRAAVATAHQFNGFDRASPGRIRAETAALRRRLAREGIDLALYPGAEVYIHVELPRNLAEGRVMTLCDGGRHLLLELPCDRLPEGLDPFLADLRSRGLEVVLAHPERNLEIREHPDRAAALASAGILLQVTAGSLTGACGRRAEAGARRLLERGLVHLVASDAHGVRGRPFHLAEARAVVAAARGEAEAEAVFRTRPEAILGAVSAGKAAVPAAVDGGDPVRRP